MLFSAGAGHAQSTTMEMVVAPTQAPSCLQAQTMVQLKKRFGPQLSFKVHFLIIEQDGHYSSFYGQDDYEEALRQQIIQQTWPAKYSHYLQARCSDLGNPVWENSAQWAGLDVKSIKVKRQAVDEAKLWQDNQKFLKAFAIKQVPTLVLNQHLLGEGVFGLAELENIINHQTGKANDRFLITLLTDPHTPQPVAEQYQAYLNRYVINARLQLRACSEAMMAKLVAQKVNALPVVLADQAFMDSYYRSYLPDKVQELADHHYLIPVIDQKDTLINRPLKPGVLKPYMQSHCPFAAELVLKLINHPLKRNGVNLTLALPGMMVFQEPNPNTATAQKKPFLFQSAHGDDELEESLRQYAIEQLYPDRYWVYAKALYSGPQPYDWQNAMQQAGLDQARLAETIAANRQDYLQAMVKDCQALPLFQSPTLLVDNRYLIKENSLYLKEYNLTVSGQCE